MGTRQTMGLFLSSLNTSTGLGVGNISLAFAFGQLWWGLTQRQPVATLDAIRQALRHPSYLMLATGFFVCGFHVAFLATHLPGVIAACGLPVQFGAWSLAMLGLFNIVGSLVMGWAVGRAGA